MGLDTVELVCEVEARFGITISDAEVACCRPVGLLNDLVARLVAERASATAGTEIVPEPELTWPLLVPLIVQVGGVSAEKFSPRLNGAAI